MADQSVRPPDSGAGPTACRHLRSKGMYITATMNPEVDDAEIGDGYCWCNRTQNVLGPDDNFAQRTSCIAGRECYDALL